MLILRVPGIELFDEALQVFTTEDSFTLELEHSLVSLSKWESKWKKPFLGFDEKTDEETIDYVRMMCLTPDVPPETFNLLSQANHDDLGRYIGEKMTATTFSGGSNGARSDELVTAELVYYWMIAHSIPFECQFWHLDRLLTLIRVCNEKNKQADPKAKKMSAREIAMRNKRLNAERRAKLRSSG